MKIGWKLPNSGPFATVDYIRRFAVEADRLGYDSVWVHDHIHRSVRDAKYHFAAGVIEAWDEWKGPILPNHYEAMSTLLFLAGITERVELGVSVIVLAYRNPVVLAKEAACLDQFSKGRFIFGVGVGGLKYGEEELNAVGAPQLLHVRGKVTDEWIDVMRGIWSEPKFSYQGKFIQVTDAEVFPKPVQKPLPILVGGFGEPAFKRTAKRGDGFMAISWTPDEIRNLRLTLRDYAAQEGRDGDALTVVSEHWLSIDNDRARAEERPRLTMSSLGSYLRRQDEPGTIRTRVGQVPERQLFGDPDTVLARVREFQDAGVDHMILRPMGRTFDEMIDSAHLFKDKVMERLPSRPAPVLV